MKPNSIIALSVLIGAVLTVQVDVARADFNPVPLTSNSFNFAVVLSSNAPKIATYAITATTGSGTSKGDNTYFEQGYYARPGVTESNLGIPVHNTIFTNINNANVTFLMPPTYLTNNDLQVDSTHTTGAFAFTTPTTVSSLAILSGGAGAGTVNYAVQHADGSQESGTLNLSDWFTPNGAQIAWGANARVSAANAFDIRSSSTANTTFPYLYSYYINGLSTSAAVTNVTITWASVNEGNFYAVSGSTDGTHYTPIPVSGFNQITTVPAPIPYPVTATMDNGTNLAAGGNTWFEQGYYPTTPTYGLPPSGSIFNSSTQPTHHYQMGNYSAASGVLIDSNHRSNNIVPAHPQPYTAFAFLTAGGNVGTGKKMTNICILQHLGGVNETNVFIGYDWFESTVPSAVAFQAGGRFALNYNNPYNGSYNNLGTVNPKLFETYFTLSDPVDTVTNIIVLFGSAPANNSTTFIMAVSATSGGISPLISSGPNPTTQTWYVGQTANFTVTVTGTQPITNTWEVESNGVYLPLTDGPDANGSYVYGSSTTTLTISNLTLADATNYQYVASNIVGGTNAGPASLTVLPDSDATAVSIVSQVPDVSVSTLQTFSNLPVEFSVTVNAGASPPISYQWYNGYPQTSGNAIPNATNANFMFTNMDGATISCIVSNIVGAVSSSPVTISVSKTPITSPTTYQSALLAYNPLAYWPMNETSGSTAYDLVGNNNGTYVGGYSLGLTGPTNATAIGSTFAVAFDGSSSYVDVPVNNLNITGPVTIVQWIETTGESANSDLNDLNFATTLSHGGASYRMDVDGSGFPHFADSAPDATGTVSIADGKWHQMIGVYDGTNEYVYIDGGLAASNLVASPPPGNFSTHVWIGGDPDYGTSTTEPDLDRIFYGDICQVTVITNALSAVQVSALYNASFTAGIATNVSPLVSEVPVGTPMTFSVSTVGPGQFYFQWSNQVGAILHATNATYAFPAAMGTNYYTVGISNKLGTFISSTAEVIGDATNPPPLLAFNGGAGWMLNSDGSYPVAPAFVNTNDLQLTDGVGSEGTSGFYGIAQSIDGFIASFYYNESGGADGVTFCLQDSQEATNAVGIPGGDLAFTGITPSAALELNIYNHGTLGPNGTTAGPGITFGTDGGTPYSASPISGYFGTGSVNLTANNPIYVQLYYSGSVLELTMIDAALDTFTTNITANLPAILGNGSAYVGFTGADGGVSSTQDVTSFLFSSTTPPVLSIAPGATAGNVVVSWPISVSSLFQLVESTSLSGPWTVAASAPFATSPDGTKNQVTLPHTGSSMFYQLELVIPAPFGPP